MYNYGIIGNCQTAALVSSRGSIDWLCLPRPDSPPVFGKLLDPDGGHFSIQTPVESQCTQSYIENTNILVTEFCGPGYRFRVTDFCPRFEQYGRTFRPPSFFRIVEPIEGTPDISIVFKPVNGWEKIVVEPRRGSSHLSYSIRGESLRVLTNMPLTYFLESTPFKLREKTFFAVTWAHGIQEDVALTTMNFFEQTQKYWKRWVSQCSIPYLYQKETIRSALALKLHCFEDTGAILAALTTSLPEIRGKQRNWDYRYCWLRDAYFTLSAFRNLGQFDEMEGFIKFLLNIVDFTKKEELVLRPVYKLDRSLPLPEYSHVNWKGFCESQPVRSGNQAAEHIQNDVYGEMMLALTPIFIDERFSHLRTTEVEYLFKYLAKKCYSSIGIPDAGPWEIRDKWQSHTFTNLICWAGLNRLEIIKDHGNLHELAVSFHTSCEKAKQAVMQSALGGILRNTEGDRSLDASLLLAPILRFPHYQLNLATTQAIRENLSLHENNPRHAFLYRYNRKDDFGTPESAFLICSFWLTQALQSLGRKEEACQIFEATHAAANHLGLLAEHYDPVKSQQLGNFPQAYSHVGLINAAFAISPSWNQVV